MESEKSHTQAMPVDAISLFELNSLVRQSVETCVSDDYWVNAEISEARINNGHCYLELIQKDRDGKSLIAKARAIVWRNTYNMLSPYFEQSTGQRFVAGIKVQILVHAVFHELYGYSLSVVDVDPSYTIGDLAQRRKDILRRLEEEGVVDLNKELPMPVLPKRIAVISSGTAAGYGDFCHQLSHNHGGYFFYVELFTALMQGNDVEQSMLAAFDRIYSRVDEFDVVVIIRGGGATSDLSCFDTYNLAAACSQFPLPIITGIGHERDDTVLDCVSHLKVKTPTAAAAFLIECMDDASNSLVELINRLRSSVAEINSHRALQLSNLKSRLHISLSSKVKDGSFLLLGLKHRLQQGSLLTLERKHNSLEQLKQRIENASPYRLFERGYSLTLKNGNVVKHAATLQKGDTITTFFADGAVESVVK